MWLSIKSDWEVKEKESYPRKFTAKQKAPTSEIYITYVINPLKFGCQIEEIKNVFSKSLNFVPITFF